MASASVPELSLALRRLEAGALGADIPFDRAILLGRDLRSCPLAPDPVLPGKLRL